MAGEPLKVRKARRRREPSIYVFALLFSGAAAYALVNVARLLARTWSGLDDGPGWLVAAFLFGDLVLAALGVWLVWMALPLWQLILRPGSPEDVVVEVAETGLTLADAGYRITLPWRALARIEVIERGPGFYRLLVQSSGDVEGTGDPVGRMVRRRLRGDGMTLRFTDQEPTEQELVEAVARHSGGQFSLAEGS